MNKRLEEAKNIFTASGMHKKITDGSMSENEAGAVIEIRKALMHGYFLCRLFGKNRTLIVDAENTETPIDRVVVTKDGRNKIFTKIAEAGEDKGEIEG